MLYIYGLRAPVARWKVEIEPWNLIGQLALDAVVNSKEMTQSQGGIAYTPVPTHLNTHTHSTQHTHTHNTHIYHIHHIYLNHTCVHTRDIDTLHTTHT